MPQNKEADRQEIIRLRRSVEELSILNDLARSIGSSLDFQEIMQTVIKRSCRAVKASQATITMVDKEEFMPNGTIVRGIEKDTPDFHLTSNLVGMMATKKQPLVFNDPKDDVRLRYVPFQDGVNNLVCVPLLVGNKLVGILAAYNKRNGKDFEDNDKRLLSIIGAQSAQILERARLFEVEQASIRMTEEVRLAGSIQMGLLPHTFPDVEGYDIFGMTIPAQQVGGDYYDYLKLDSGNLGLAIGDISGKGIPASLLMANLQATLRSLTLQETSCASTVAACSKLLFRSTPVEKFATLFYSVLNPQTHKIVYSNAGHEHPLILSADGSIRTLTAGGLPAGILDEFDYQEDTEVLAVGEIMVLYSDGVTDMIDHQEVPYGDTRFRECVLENRCKTAQGIAQALVASVQRHAGNEPPLDDLTVMIIKRMA